PYHRTDTHSSPTIFTISPLSKIPNPQALLMSSMPAMLAHGPLSLHHLRANHTSLLYILTLLTIPTPNILIDRLPASAATAVYKVHVCCIFDGRACRAVFGNEGGDGVKLVSAEH